MMAPLIALLANDETRAKSLAMGSFGERLRREREMRGITLNEIAESTKISRRHLESLEKEDFDSLPGGIFNKGFVRAYARYLGIDEDQAVTDYSAASNEQTPPEDKFPLEISHEPDPELNPRRSSLPLILSLLALVAVLAVFWARSRMRPAESPENAGAAAGAAGPGVSAASPPASGSATVTPAVTELHPAAASVPVNAVKKKVLQPPAASTPRPEHAFVVRVAVKEDSWVSLTADGKTVVARILIAGEQQLVRAGSKVVLTTGNAGGLEVSFNGKSLGPLGNESEVRTLTFTPSGLVQ
jgi:cytoskeleton protein RodZ